MGCYREAQWGCSESGSTCLDEAWQSWQRGPRLPSAYGRAAGGSPGLGHGHWETADRELGMCSQVQLVGSDDAQRCVRVCCRYHVGAKCRLVHFIGRVGGFVY